MPDRARFRFLLNAAFLTLTLAVGAACSHSSGPRDGGSGGGALTFDTSGWSHDADHDVYWKIGVGYCTNPESTTYETFGIYVPGAYLSCSAEDGGTYTCTPSGSGVVSGYTATTAPIVIPVNTPGYSAAAAPTAYSYSNVSAYLAAGYVYFEPGMRGRANGSGDDAFRGGAPWGVTDLKAAIRYYRYNKASLPGDTGRMFTFGMSGGGAQSTVAGASGDSTLYLPYLESIGAAITYPDGTAVSDALYGAMAWCPITSLDHADEAYEWNMGQFFSTGARASGTFAEALSRDLAASYASHLNSLGLVNEAGQTLTLTTSNTGIYQAGSYYDEVLALIDTSLNNFISDTTFPYTPSSGGGPPGGLGDGGSSSSTTYDTLADYLASLNSDAEWITYDASTNTASVSSVADFVVHLKSASKSVPAFDALDRTQAENDLFGNSASDILHFDPVVAGLLDANASTYAALGDWDSSLPSAYANDLAQLDDLRTSMTVRQNTYSPLYFVNPTGAGYGTAMAAKHWRVRSGIEQGDTALTVELNLALALKANPSVESVDFAAVWGQGHTQAERTGSADTNFIAWVREVAAP